MEKVISGLPAWDGRIVIDGENPVDFIGPNSPDAKASTTALVAYGIKARSGEQHFSDP